MNFPPSLHSVWVAVQFVRIDFRKNDHAMKDTRRSFILCFALLCSFLSFGASPDTAKFSSGNKQIAYEVFGPDSTGPILILLHGASGPGIPFYRQQAGYFAAKGYIVLYLHYFDATGSSAPSDKNYAAWAQAVGDLVRECNANPSWSSRKIALMGFSLGASVALAAGSQRVPVDAIADWYGSLPDSFFEQRKGMPPLLILHGQQDSTIPIVNAQQLARLCEMEHYGGEGHGFSDASLKDADQRTLEFLARKLK